MISSRSRTRTQYAALPFAVRDGEPQVMLITSRETGRWVIPKGWPEKKVKPYDLAAREAYEEAGLLGKVARKPLGSYRYEKQLSAKKAVSCVVHVYRLEVQQELDDWPEKGQRERCWMSPSQAALLVSESGLARILLRLGGSPPEK